MQLINAPNRDNFTGVSSVIVSIPNPNRGLIEYRILEASTFEESLQNQFPEIRSFVGNAVKMLEVLFVLVFLLQMD